MGRTACRNVTEQLMNFFTIYGLPKMIVSDNGPPFNSFDFSQFCKKHDIILEHSPPYHPQSNGLAERNVQTVKKVLRKFLITSDRNLLMQNTIKKIFVSS